MVEQENERQQQLRNVEDQSLAVQLHLLRELNQLLGDNDDRLRISIHAAASIFGRLGVTAVENLVAQPRSLFAMSAATVELAAAAAGVTIVPGRILAVIMNEIAAATAATVAPGIRH